MNTQIPIGPTIQTTTNSDDGANNTIPGNNPLFLRTSLQHYPNNFNSFTNKLVFFIKRA